jgi:hypothetical protein
LQLYVGDLAGAGAGAGAAGEKKATAAPTAEKKKVAAVGRGPSGLAFGEQIPYGDPSWYQDWNSPYFTDAHRKFRAAMRAFVDKEIAPFAHQWDEAKELPRELWARCYEAGWLAGVIGPPW